MPSLLARRQYWGGRKSSKELCGEKRKNKEEIFINEKDGKLLTEPEPVKERWKEYIEELYAMDEKPREIELVS